MTIFEIVKELDLPLGQYVVFGSGPLAAHGIRESGDVDLFVTKSLYEKLKQGDWEEKQMQDGSLSLTKDSLEVFTTWRFGSYDPTPEEIIEKAEIINDVAFVPLSEVRKWKAVFGRPKDLDDVALIDGYLTR